MPTIGRKTGVPRYGTVFTPQDNVSLSANGGENTSSVFDVSLADTIVLTAKNGNSNNLVVEVYSSWDGTNWDTVPYASMNLGANETKSLPVTPGIFYCKVKVVNNDTTNSTTVTTKLIVTFR